MKNKLIKSLTLVLAGTTILSSIPVNVFADDEEDDGIEYQSSDEEEFSNNTNVNAELASEYKVTIPKVIVLSGATKKANYYVQVEGDIAGTEAIRVVPDASFDLASQNKASQTATVLQNKTAWMVSDFGTKTVGSIAASGLTAGSWSGTFNFNVNLNSDGAPIELSFNESSISLTLTNGTNRQIELPSGYDIEDATVTSSNPAVAIVENGKIKTIGVGITTVTITLPDGKTQEIVITVNPANKDDIPNNIVITFEDDITVDEDGKVELIAGNSNKINLSSNNGIDLNNVVIESSNPDVVTVDENGNIKAVGVGEATIVIKSEGSKDKVITIKVNPADNIVPTFDKDVVVNEDGSISIEAGKDSSLNLASNNSLNLKNVTVTSSNPDIVTVDEDGNIIATGVGEATITIKSDNSVDKVITVKVDPTDNIVPTFEESINVDEQGTVNVSFDDETSLNVSSNNTMPIKDEQFISSDENIITIDESGNIKAVGEGTATITIKSTNSKDKVVTIKVGHKAKAAVIENEVAATCTAVGGYDNVVYCEGCNAKLSSEHTTINALGHNYTSKTTTSAYLKSAATCTAAATYYYKCSRCTEKGSSTYTSGSALGHNYKCSNGYSLSELKSIAQNNQASSKGIKVGNTIRLGNICTRCQATSGSIVDAQVTEIGSNYIEFATTSKVVDTNTATKKTVSVGGTNIDHYNSSFYRTPQVNNGKTNTATVGYNGSNIQSQVRAWFNSQSTDFKSSVKEITRSYETATLTFNGGKYSQTLNGTVKVTEKVYIPAKADIDAGKFASNPAYTTYGNMFWTSTPRAFSGYAGAVCSFGNFYRGARGVVGSYSGNDDLGAVALFRIGQ